MTKLPWRQRLNTWVIRAPKNREQLKKILRHAQEQDILSVETLSMIESVLQVSEMRVREVMIPKAKMVAIQEDSTFETILPMIIESGHSRFPVFDAQGEDIIGILLAKDLLKYYFNRDPKVSKTTDLLRPTTFVPQSKRLDILLREFRITRNHMAMVLDEYGHVEGLVTIEDVLEQIVGEIEDEYDIDEGANHIRKLEDGSWIVKTSTSVEDFNKTFHTHFKDDEFDTLGGILLKEFGYLPKRGEATKIDNLRFKVLHSDNRQIYLVEVKKE